MKICIGVPTNRGVKPKTVKCLLDLIARGGHEFYNIVADRGYTVTENRNYIVVEAMKNECSHLLFIDDDMTFPEHTLNQLLKNQKEIVGVVAYSRALPLMPVVEFLDQEETEIADRLLGRWKIPSQTFKCKAVGGGVLLIDLKVFEKLERPWFDMKTDERGWTTMGEDSYFCRNATKAGYEIWCDPSLLIGHIGDYVYGRIGI